MGFFSRFEHRVEDGFEGINEKLFDAPISPVQIAKKAEKQMRREKMVGAGKEYAPTLYTILVNPEDDERLFGYYPTLAGETETYLRAKAMDQGLLMDGTPLVRFIVDDDLKPGKFDVIAELVSAPIIKQLRNEEFARYGIGGTSAPNNPAANAQQQFAPQNNVPANQAYAANEALPPLQNNSNAYVQEQNYASAGVDVMAEDPAQYDNYDAYNQGAVAEPIAVGQTMFLNSQGNAPQESPLPQGEPHLINLTTGRSFPLTSSRILIGRAIDCDIILNDLNVSRKHAELRQESTTVWSIADLGSTNGTLVNGKHIPEIMLKEGDRITTGTTTFLFTYN